MKKFLFLPAILLVLTVCRAQTVNYSTPKTVTSYTFYTNDEQYPTVLQRANDWYCLIGPIYTASLRVGTTPITITDFNFAPGYNYTLQIQGTTSVSGYISKLPTNLGFVAALWPATPMSNERLSLNPFQPSADSIYAYAGLLNLSCFGYRSSVDFFGTWLQSFLVNTTIPLSSTQVYSVKSSVFQATSVTNQLTIELGPVIGDDPFYTYPGGGYGNCGCIINATVPQVNAVLNINQIILTATPIQTAQINGASYYSFSGSNSSGGGTITAMPGATVTVTVTGSGAPGGTYTTECNLSGVVFSTGSGSLLATNTSNTATFIMPASGAVTWTGNYSYTSSAGGGSISVQ